MKLQIMSDLHMEHWTRGDGLQFEKDTQTTADVLVLAGDLLPLNRRTWSWSGRLRGSSSKRRRASGRRFAAPSRRATWMPLTGLLTR